MQWSDIGIVLGARNLGENKTVLTVFTQNNGKQLGVFRTTKTNKAYIQPGTKAKVSWNARLSEQLGTWSVDPIAINCSAVINNPAKLCALTTTCHILNWCTPERAVYVNLFNEFDIYIKHLITKPSWLKQHIMFELAILRDLGYGLDLSCCAATGATDNLAYVSPRSGRAVSLAAGAPYIDRLLQLPQFLIGGTASKGDELAGLNLTKYFIEKHLLSYTNKSMPHERQRLEKLY